MAATRMTTAQMLPAAPILDEMGFNGLETWGGATIDSCLRFLNENPFDRLRTLKKAAPKTPQLMLLRGQNIVQYTSFPDDVVEAFVRCMCENGMDIIRIFDALNDVRNLQTAIKAVKKYGKHARGELCYTISPAHTVENFVKHGRRTGKNGLRFPRHQGHVGHSAAADRLRSGQGTQEPGRPSHHPAYPRHRRLGRRQLSGRH